ncbi:hypothetical protein HMPREF3227_01488 [Corynebacterium sp. CMW7794]|nr:hypothetical protein HMPREF3227_01488 [Corynebacterium sp. CMW7794]
MAKEGETKVFRVKCVNGRRGTKEAASARCCAWMSGGAGLPMQKL